MFPKNSEKIALIAEDKQVSYHDLIQHIHSFSLLFSAGSQERVLIFSENRPEWIYAFYAIWQHRAIPVPVDFLSGAEDVAFILADSAPVAVFCSSGRREMLDHACEKCDIRPPVIVFEDITTLNKEPADQTFPETTDDDTAVIIYTSGTTGSPKGVMLSFDNLLANIEGITLHVEIYSASDRVMILLPLHHIFPLMGSMIIPLYVGGTVAIAPSLNPQDILKTLQENRITIVIGVPRFYNLIMKGIRDIIRKSPLARVLFSLAGTVKSEKLSRLLFTSVHKKFGGEVRYLVSGGAALDIETARDFGTLGFEVLEGYGMTEAAPMITFSRPGKYLPGSVGFTLPANQMEIRDGEVVAKGRNIMKGYFNRPEETAQVLKDGWLYTGDLGTIDVLGYLYITGRKKEIIVTSNGKNINPESLEKKLVESSPYITDAGVFLKHDTLQAILVADLHKMKLAGITGYEDHFKWQVVDALNTSLSPYKRIMKFVITTEELPKTRLGKLQRFKLEELAGSMVKDRKVEAVEPGFKEYKEIRDYLETETGEKIYPDDHLEMDIALDSLGKITLLVFIETTFGVKIPEEEFMNYHTVLKLSEYVRQKKTRSVSEVVNWSQILREKVHITLPETKFSLTLLNGISKLLLNTYFRMHGEGKKNIPPGPCIIAPNHQSFFDGLFVASFLKNPILKRTYVYAKEKYWRKKWLQFIAHRNNIILMDINRDLKLSLQQMAAALKRGKNIIIFPEGTRSKDGKLGQFKKTFAILSQELNVPVVPVAISGSYKVLPSGSWFPRPFKRVSVKFLQPVFPLNHTYDTLTQAVQDKVARQLDV
jgi:long-chain acyl-CoA synthetase